ncbi:SMP-30/gluconolactonase/LRE family protein [Parasphingopyxis marina]|uniref:SMP-30/Gluconolactonase/LRE-like region domain-containing protein n=1 Tax=Parasphingopyxis marina TaxID=2761622 RepID=A0A842HUC9_9SPHN|nr:hypothetical protein [Parasphingopyxis marina]MBC2777578.1 hypothetical protein [Parasphingopyxis marina]
MPSRPAAIFALGLLMATPAMAEGETWRDVGPAEERAFDLERLDTLTQAYPDSGTMLRAIIATAHQVGDGDAVRGAFERFAVMGGGLSEGSMTLVSGYFEEARWAALTATVADGQSPVAASEVVAAVPADINLVEGVAWDSRRATLYAGSVVERGLYRLSGETWERVPLPENSGSLFGMAYDAGADTLWLVSGAADPTPDPDTAFRGLIAYSPESRSARMLAAPGEGAMSGDIALGQDGSVYVSNSIGGAIYRCRPGCLALETIVEPNRFRSPQGMAVSLDGAWLYVSDYSHGLAAIDLDTGAIFRVAATADMLLDGIDGLLPDGGDLIAIRNGSLPMQIMRLQLSEDGLRVEQATVIERNHPDWGEPTLGAFRGAEFLYVSDAQWERFGADGAPDPGIAPRPTPIRSVRLR